MSASRRDLVRLSALAASALALPALADTKPLKPMRLLILGGTGFIGPHQVRYALARGHHVTIFNRGRQPEAWPGAVEELLGDRNGDLKALEGRDWDVCIDNPASLPVWVRDAARVLKGHVGQYVFISTISVYAANDTPADETAPLVAYKGDDPMAETIKSLNANQRLYGPLKALSEKEARTQYGQDADRHRPDECGQARQVGGEADQQEYQGVGDEAEVLPQIVQQPTGVLGHADLATVTAVDEPGRDARQRT